MISRRVALLVVAAGLGACGGSAPAPSTPASVPGGGAPPDTPGLQYAPPPAPPPPPPSVPPLDQPNREESRTLARKEVEHAIHDLEAASGDCAAVCRALASMERAAAHLCSLADQDDDRRRCDDARQRLTAAQTRVRSACGVCP